MSLPLTNPPQVTDFDLFDPDTNDLLESANIGCGLGELVG